MKNKVRCKQMLQLTEDLALTFYYYILLNIFIGIDVSEHNVCLLALLIIHLTSASVCASNLWVNGIQ